MPECPNIQALLAELRRDYQPKRELGTCDHENPAECERCDDQESYVEHRCLVAIDALCDALQEVVEWEHYDPDYADEVLQREHDAAYAHAKNLLGGGSHHA